jgi:excinuclease ABC subunit B
MESARFGGPGSRQQAAALADEAAPYHAQSPELLLRQIRKLEEQMYRHARDLEFEEAANLRDRIRHIRKYGLGLPDEDQLSA